MWRVACESRLPFFRWYILVKFCFFILVYMEDDKSHLFSSFYFLMVNHLFVKKAVPLYIKEKEIVLTN